MAAKILPRSFYEQPTVEVAKQLIGKILVHQTSSGITSGMIVETEAYLYPHDEAAHTFKGKTTRNEAMFGPPGRAYVYFTYGMHYCMNAVTSAEGEGVLIRALEPIEGLELMKKRRNQHNPLLLCNGPGKLTQALGITREQNGLDLTDSNVVITRGKGVSSTNISSSVRIGISRSMDLELRFFLKRSPFLSRNK